MAFEITRLDEIQIENLSVSALDDVQLTNVVSGDYLSYEPSSGKWVNKQIVLTAEVTGTFAVSGATDVGISNPVSGDVLTYDDINKIWINKSVTQLIDEVETPVITVEQNYTKRVDFTSPSSATDIIYKGWATVGSVPTNAVWRIVRITMTNSDGDMLEEWADGNDNYDNIWNDRASLPYS